jgi:hypothetical protein
MQNSTLAYFRLVSEIPFVMIMNYDPPLLDANNLSFFSSWESDQLMNV